MPGHVASCGYVEMQDKFALMFWSDTLARDGKCHFDARLLKATCCPGRGQDRQGILDGDLRKHLMSCSV